MRKVLTVSQICQELVRGLDVARKPFGASYRFEPGVESQPGWVPYRSVVFLPQPFKVSRQRVQVYDAAKDAFHTERKIEALPLDVEREIRPYAASIAGWLNETQANVFGELPLPAAVDECARVTSRGISIRVIRQQVDGRLILRADALVARPMARW